jgi:hypothetical protein
MAATSIAFEQGTFKPRNADEEHAWRLYNQYKESKQKEAQFKAGITQKSGDIKTTNVGIIPLYIDPEDVAQLTKLRQQLQAEQEKQKNLETAWDKKFWGRYGDLSDSAGTIYDVKTKQTMDKIQYRLIYFPFYVNDGTYIGNITGAPGQITLIVSGTSIKGSAKGVYKYTIGSDAYSEPFAATITGTLNTNGWISGQISGTIGGAPFTGTMTGSISKGVASGTWTGTALTTASGSFRATMK